MSSCVCDCRGDWSVTVCMTAEVSRQQYLRVHPVGHSKNLAPMPIDRFRPCCSLQVGLCRKVQKRQTTRLCRTELGQQMPMALFAYR